MKSLSWVLFFVLFATSSVFADEVAASSGTVITTSRSSLTLTPPADLVSEGALISAGRTAEIAAGEVDADIQVLVKEENALKKEITAFDEVIKSGKAEMDEIKRLYDKEKAKYEVIAVPLEAEILAFNARPPSQRDEETHRQLTIRKAAADKKFVRLELKRVASDESIEKIVARIKIAHDSLQEKITKWNSVKLPRMGLAYRQLKLVVEYAKQINKILLERYPTPWQLEGKHPGYNPDGKYPVLDGAMEQIKALSARGFDTE